MERAAPPKPSVLVADDATIAPQSLPGIRIVLIEDSPSDALMVRAALSERFEHCSCVTVSTLRAGLQELDAHATDVVLVDLGLPDSDGLDTVEAVVHHLPDLAVVVLTGFDDDRVGELAISRGAQDYLVKGRADADAIGRSIRHAIERKRLEGEVRRSHQLLDRIIENIPDGLFVKEADGLVFERVNPAGEVLLGYPAAAILGSTERDLLPRPASDVSDAHDRAALANGSLFDVPLETVDLGPRGRRVVHSRRIPLNDDRGRGRHLLTIYEDITDQQSFKDEQLFRLLVQSVSDYAIYMLDADGRVSSWNTGAEHIQGYTADEVEGRPVSLFYTADDVASGRPGRCLDLAISQGRFEEDAWRLRKDGTGFWANTLVTPIYDSDGILVGFAAVTRDLTERRRVDRRTFDLVPVAIVGCDLDLRVTSWNQGAQDTYGWSADEALGRSFADLVAPDGALPTAVDLQRVIDEGTWEGEWCHRTRAGSVVTIEGRWTCCSDEAGKPAGCFGILRDITDRRAMEDALEETRARLTELIDIAPDAIISIGADQNVLLFNPGAEATFGFTSEEMIGRPLDLLLPDVSAEEHRSAVERFGSVDGPPLGMAERRKLDGRRKDGSLFPAEASISAMRRGGDGTFTAIVHDVSERVAAEELLALQAEQLVRSNAELEEFAYVASHDLSEPLRTVAGFVQLLAQRYQGRLDDDADEFIGFTLDGVKRMQALIQDLLTYSRVSRVEYSIAEVDSGSIVCDVVEELEAGDTVQWSELPVVTADAGQLRRVFQNLLSNGLKFIPTGRVPRVTVSATTEPGAWLFTVADNGIGIPIKYHERIFKMFQRLHSADEYPGTGIGLAVCQRIVQRHGGRIWLDSVDGEGTAFHFTIPSNEGVR